MSFQSDQRELLNLVDAVCSDFIDDAGWERLEEILLADHRARALYRRYVNSHIGLRQYLGARGVTPGRKPIVAPVLEFLGNGLHQVASFCWRATPFSLFMAVGLPLFFVMLFFIQFRHFDIPDAPPAVSPPVRVARLDRALNCRWTDEAPTPTVGESFVAGREIELIRGLAEITTSNGATFILEGPATLVIESGRQVELKAGKLAAAVPQRARGFTVKTAHASVVDLGTEFGVFAGDEEDAAVDVEVFKGHVELRTPPDAARRDAFRRRIVAGDAVRIARAGARPKTVIRNIEQKADRFVRRFPATVDRENTPAAAARPRPSIVADFSGGNGSTRMDQFPGIPGDGWASEWSLDKIDNVESTAWIENTNPLLGGGDYLRVLATRKSGTAHERRSIVRRLDLHGPMDIRKPHLVSFDFRVDELDLFAETHDAVTICNNSKSDRELNNIPSGGWHLRFGPEPRNTTTNYWRFCDRGRVVRSGVVVAEGNVYSFRILVDPTSGTWTPSIAVNGGRFQRFQTMRMRCAGPPEKYGYWPYLHFRWGMAGGNKGNNRERIGFSVDSIRIVQGDEAGREEHSVEK
jgi:hypothetical protein